jgi:hypothetical protein
MKTFSPEASAATPMAAASVDFPVPPLEFTNAIVFKIAPITFSRHHALTFQRHHAGTRQRHHVIGGGDPDHQGIQRIEIAEVGNGKGTVAEIAPET